jgi:NAD(P)-dependent dehydrogenase (short-subunit alcohol dehydrogenase family)
LEYIAFLSLLHAGNQKVLGKTGYSSQIIVMSSIAGYSKQIQASIDASNAAATHLARNFAIYFVNLKIRVNVIVPGLYPGELTGATKSDDTGHVPMEGGRDGSLLSGWEWDVRWLAWEHS